ncbi:MAG: hypothetical protein GF383_02120 [Candidatus Lokiarchaeota archaeon]|nr:hypothetical protein [Candidatus Lokiarchaeota archaeon]MBD3338210.1 hypothetical protein [Candidatus Lokiarchaeota archaeon]
MNKSLKIILGIFFIGIIIGASVFAVFFFIPSKSKSSDDDDDDDDILSPPTPSLIYVFVNSTIYTNLTSELSQFKDDIVNQGFQIQIINTSMAMFPTHDILKNNLTVAYYQNNLIGAIFIGRIFPIYWDYMYYGQQFYTTCDLFYMDLDGQWSNSGLKPNIFNSHIAGPGDLYPEIWLANICPESLTNCNHTELYEKYFERNHKYRTGQLMRPHKALLYVDDEWSQWINEWKSNLTAYTGNQLDYFYINETTTASLYKDNLTAIETYELVHLIVHSSNKSHLFGAVPVNNYNPADGIVTSNDIRNLNTQPLFYSFLACYTCNHTFQDNIATEYLFSNNTLVVVGDGEPGGLWMHQPYYDNLKQGKTFGEAYYNWFQNPQLWAGHINELYGMTLLGDPLLTIF